MLNLARVVAINWEFHTVNVIMIVDGRPVNNVRVMSPMASTSTGLNDLADPFVVSKEKALKDGGKSVEREIIAVMANFNNLPVVLGFLHPVGSQMLFADKERMIYRHASDVYHTIDKDGNIELRHPGGAYVRFGTSSAHEDLTGKDYNKKWKITKNTSKQVHIHIEQAGGVASVDIAPNGAITVTSAASISATAPTTHITSEVIVTGNVSVSGDVVAGSGSANISLLHHVHSGILPGPANTGAPV